MAKRIEFTRRELIWEEYHRSWGERDYRELLAWLAQSTDPVNQTRLSVLEELSFDDIYDFMSGRRKGQIPCWEIEWTSYGGEKHTYTEDVYDYITEIMREEAFDYGPCDSYGADDSEEFVEYYDLDASCEA